METEALKEISIESFLIKRGFSMEKKGRLTFCNSPFSDDSTPSFCIYPGNTFYDWANGVGGDIIKLVEEMEGISFLEAKKYLDNGDYSVIDFSVLKEEPPKKKFVVENYLTDEESEVRLINKYAFGRGITNNFHHSCFYLYNDGEFIRRPSLGFVHVDEDLNICGIKMRDVSPFKGRRFSARGDQKFYIISNNDETTNLYIVESESSANSLLDFLSIINIPAKVVSFGSWNNIPRQLPDSLEKLNKKSLIIDYDGNEDLYNEKIEKFNHFNAREVKLQLPKGEDINSLFVKGSLYRFKDLIVNK